MYINHLELALKAAKAAGEEVMNVYKEIVTVKVKGDGSPLTIADERSHNTIMKMLRESGLPIVSEEGDGLLMGETTCWVVDPLDGTKDFLAANDEFVVNIALVEDGYPVLGVLYAPALDELYYTAPGAGVWFENAAGKELITAKPASTERSMAVSRFHNSEASAVFARENGISKEIPVGSALKLGRIARGVVDVYPRLVGTSEWDTAAGQAVLEASGGFVIDLKTGKRLAYGKPDRRNNPFLAMRHPYRFEDFRTQEV